MEHVSKTFTGRRQAVHALTGIDLDLFLGETLGLVGESGCGKTTLARVLVGLSPQIRAQPSSVGGRRSAR